MAFNSGRKPKGVGERFAVMAWFQALSNRLGVTADQMRKLYVRDVESSAWRSNIFYKYRDGTSFPETYLREIEIKHIDLETMWIHGKLFKLLDNKLLTETDLIGISFSSEDISDAVCGDIQQNGFRYLAFREDADWIEKFDRVSAFNNLEGFSALMLLLRQCEISYRLGFVYMYGCRLLLDMWRVVYLHPVLGKFAENIFGYLEKRFIPKQVPTSKDRSVWLDVEEMRSLRIEAIQSERIDWTTSSAFIPSRWYVEYVRTRPSVDSACE